MLNFEFQNCSTLELLSSNTEVLDVLNYVITESKVD